jgi:hypothetical protein
MEAVVAVGFFPELGSQQYRMDRLAYTILDAPAHSPLFASYLSTPTTESYGPIPRQPAFQQQRISNIGGSFHRTMTRTHAQHH